MGDDELNIQNTYLDIDITDAGHLLSGGWLSLNKSKLFIWRITFSLQECLAELFIQILLMIKSMFYELCESLMDKCDNSY